MSKTNTEEKLEALLDDAEYDVRRRRRNWAVGALVATAAVIALVAWVANVGFGRPETVEPAEPTSPTDVATEFLNAYASFDQALAASYLAESALEPDWRLVNRWNEAIGFRLMLDSCEEVGATSSGTQVQCPYDFHALHSEELGRGPFGDSLFTMTIGDDGRIVAADTGVEFMANGFSAQMWEPFAAWVAREHPQDAAIMYADWPSQSMQSMTPRSIALWDEYSQEYADAQSN